MKNINSRNMFFSIHLMLVFFLALHFSGSEAIAQENLLKNGSFEEASRQNTKSPLSWCINKSSANDQIIRIKDGQFGKFAVKIVSKSGGDKISEPAGIVSDTLNITNGLYVFKGWYKTEVNNATSVKYTLLDTLGNLIEEITKELLPSKEWKEFSIPISVWHHYRKKFRDKAYKIKVELLANNSIVYFDNISLAKSTDPIVLRLFPAEYGRGYLPFVKDAPNFIRFMLSGDKDRIKGDVVIELDMPDGANDYGIFNGGEAVQIDGELYKRFHISIPQKQIDKIKEKTGYASVTCWFNVDGIKDNKKIYYRASINGKEFTTKEVNIKVLPPLADGPLPKRFKRVVSWATFGDTYKGSSVGNIYMPKQLYPAIYELVRKMGFNILLIFNSDERKGWRKYIYEHIKQDGGEIWANIPPEFYQKYNSGKGWETKAINGGVERISELCGDYYIKMKPLADAVHFDFEPRNAEENPLWDDIPTKKMFAKKYGYDFSKLTKERLQGKLRQQWMMFRTWQIGEGLRLWAKYVHSINPDWELTVSQGNGNPKKHINYWVYNDIPNITHMPQIYTGNSMYITRTIISLIDRYPTAKFFPVVSSMVVADKGWAAVNPLYSPFVSMAMLGCVGGAQWPDIRRGYDMEYVWQISHAMRDIAYLEDYVYDGKVLDNVTFKINGGSINWEENSLARAYKLEGKILIAFNNMNENNSADVKVSLKNMNGNNWKVFDPVSKKNIPSATGEYWNKKELLSGLPFNVSSKSLGMLIIEKEE